MQFNDKSVKLRHLKKKKCSRIDMKICLSFLTMKETSMFVWPGGEDERQRLEEWPSGGVRGGGQRGVRPRLPSARPGGVGMRTDRVYVQQVLARLRGVSSFRSVFLTACARTPTTTPTLVCALSPPLPTCSTASLMTTRYGEKNARTPNDAPGRRLTGRLRPPLGFRRSLQRDCRSLPADQHRKNHRPGGPGEDEPPADDAAVLLRTDVPNAGRVRPEVGSQKPRPPDGSACSNPNRKRSNLWLFLFFSSQVQVWPPTAVPPPQLEAEQTQSEGEMRKSPDGGGRGAEMLLQLAVRWSSRLDDEGIRLGGWVRRRGVPCRAHFLLGSRSGSL